MTLLAGVPSYWLWLIAAGLLAMAEILAPGVFLVWLGIAAALVGLLTLALGISAAAQFALFALLAIAAVYAGRRWVQLHPIRSDDPLLNARTDRLVGRTVTVSAAIDRGEGRVRVGDSDWAARGPDVPVGALVRIVGATSSCLSVEPLP